MGVRDHRLRVAIVIRRTPMQIAQLTIAGVTGVIAGCSLVLPATAPEPAFRDSAAASCTLELAEARKSRSAAPNGEVGSPLIATLAGDPSDDRAIRSGNRIMLVRGQDPNPGMTNDPAAVTVEIAAAAGSATAQEWIRDGSAVHLRAMAPRAGGLGTSDRQTAAAAGGGLVIYKADTPNPNRPTTCDPLLRDGDFVLVWSALSQAWVTIANSALDVQARSPQAVAHCRESQERCYTDRYGAPVCASFYTCAPATEL